MKGSYIVVGEDIHCTRVRKTNGKYVVTLADGTAAIMIKDGDKNVHAPIPEHMQRGSDWDKGNVRHVAAAIWQGMNGKPEDQKAGVAYLHAMVRSQEAHGAHFLDLNVDEYSVDVEEKAKAMEWTAEVIQQVATVPLSIDSSNEETLITGLKACKTSLGKPLLNSLSLERVSSIKPAVDYNAKVIATATGKEKMPETQEERLTNIRGIVNMLKEKGYKNEDIYLDPLVFPVAVNSKNGVEVIETIKKLREEYGPDIHFAPGLSNVSFGLPKRKIINQAFAHICWEAGCDGGIVDPLQINSKIIENMDTSSKAFNLAKDLLLGNDEYGMKYIAACRAGEI